MEAAGTGPSPSGTSPLGPRSPGSTLALAKLAYADRGRGTGLWMAAFFGGEFVCPLVLIGVESATGSLANAVGLLGLAAALTAGGLLWAGRRAAASASSVV